jgi:hypothetical protein
MLFKKAKKFKCEASTCTAKTKCRKLEKIFPEKE